MSKEIDYLTEDEPIQNQLFVCMSFLSPEGIRNCNVRGLKLEEYITHKKKLIKEQNIYRKLIQISTYLLEKWVNGYLGTLILIQ